MSDSLKLYSIFQGEVCSVQPYGVFVKIPGSKKNGLVHKSQMSTMRIESPDEVCSVGEQVYCKLISMDSDGDKIGLSMKVVSQTSGKDLDPSHVQSSLDEQRRRTGHVRETPRINLEAVLHTTCSKCGGSGHFAKDCFFRPGGKTYELLTDADTMTTEDVKDSKAHTSRKKHKSEKKKKKHKKNKSSHMTDHDHHVTKKSKKKKKKRSFSDDSDSSSLCTSDDEPRRQDKASKRKLSGESKTSTSQRRSGMYSESPERKSDKTKFQRYSRPSQRSRSRSPNDDRKSRKIRHESAPQHGHQDHRGMRREATSRSPDYSPPITNQKTEKLSRSEQKSYRRSRSPSSRSKLSRQKSSDYDRSRSYKGHKRSRSASYSS